MNCILIRVCSALLFWIAVSSVAGQTKQFTLKPSGHQHAVTEGIPSSSVMSSIPAPSERDEGIKYTLMEEAEIPASPTPPLSRDDVSLVRGGSSLTTTTQPRTGPRTVSDSLSSDSDSDTVNHDAVDIEVQRPTDANSVLSSPLHYHPVTAANNDSISLEPSTVVSTAPPTSDMVTPPLEVSPSLNTASLTTLVATHPLTSESVPQSASTTNPCSTCSPCISCILAPSSDSPTPQQSLKGSSSQIHPSKHLTSGPSLNPPISQTTVASSPSSSLLTSPGHISCTFPPCSSTPVTDASLTSLGPSAVFIPGNSSHFITRNPEEYQQQDYEEDSTSVSATTHPDLSPSPDDSFTSLNGKQTVSTAPDIVITSQTYQSNSEPTNNTSAHDEQPLPSNFTWHSHSEPALIDFAIKFTASSRQRCVNRPSIEKTSDFVLHSLEQSFNLGGSHVFISNPSCHCMTVNFLSLQRGEVRKVEALIRSHKIIYVMNFTVNGVVRHLQLIGRSTVRFDSKNLGGGADECRLVMPKKVPWRRLSKAEQIIVITVCVAGAMVVFAAFLFCMYEVRRRHTRKSFRLQSGTATMVRTEDYSLTKLDRPNTMYTDRGMIMEPVQPDDVPLPTMYASNTSLEKPPPGAHLANNSPQKEWPLAPDPFPIRPSTSTENLVTAAARSRKKDKLPGYDNPSFSSDDILASDTEENESCETKKKVESHDTYPEMNGFKKPLKSNLLRPLGDHRSESIT